MKQEKWKKYSQWLAVGALLLIAWWLRLRRLGEIPAGATVDEVSYGYIAYSLSRTGADEHGVSWPLVFKAYGDQKLPGQVYLILPLVHLFGLNLTAVRLPAALASCALIVLIYVMLTGYGFSRWIAATVTVLWTISPAPFILGRGAWESNLAMACFTLGLLALPRWWRAPRRSRQEWLWLWVWSLGMAAAWYFYVPYRAISVVLGLTVVAGTLLPSLGAREKCASALRHLGLVTALIAPLLIWTRASTNTTRLSQLGGEVLSGLEMEINEKRTFCEFQGELPRWWCDAMYNKPLIEGQKLVRAAFSSIGVDFLALYGEENLDMIQIRGFGEICLAAYLLCLVAVIPLAVACFQPRHHRHAAALMTVIMLVVTLGPAVLVGVQKVRMSAVFPVLFLIAAWGLEWLASVGGQFWRENAHFCGKAVIALALLALTGYTVLDWASFQTSFFAYHYFKNDWQTLGHVQRIDQFLAEMAPERISWHANYPDALMFYAFDTAFDPATYQQKAVLGELEANGWQHTVALGDNLVISGRSALELADCGHEATPEAGLHLVVEQDGNVLRQIADYREEYEAKQATSAQSLPPMRSWPIYTVNGANVVAEIVDVAWVREVWCTPKAESFEENTGEEGF